MTTRAIITLALAAAGILAAKEPTGQGSRKQARQVYILTGQSNSLGAVKGSPASPELLQQYESAARLWNGNMNRDSGECFETNPQWETVAPQLPRYNGSLCMGPEYGFSAMMQRLSPQSGTDIIKASLDGGGNHYWQPGGNAYNTLLAVVKRAMKEEKKAARISALLYLQGESDAGEEVSLARQRFLELVKNLKKDLKKAGVSTAGLKYCVIGEPANWHGQDKTVEGKTTAGELRSLADSRPDIGWVHTRDLTKITKGDTMGVHYDGKSQITIGARFACALLALQGKIPAGMRGDAIAALDREDAWWGGRLPGKETIAVWNVASANTVEKLGGALSPKGIRVEDTFAGTLTIQGQGQASLTVGSGGIELQGADLQLEQVKLTLTEGAGIQGTKSASLTGGSLILHLGPEELEPAGDKRYSTKKLSAVQSLTGNAVSIRLSPALTQQAAGQPTDILFLHGDGSPVDFSATTLQAPLKAGEPGHLIIPAQP